MGYSARCCDGFLGKIFFLISERSERESLFINLFFSYDFCVIFAMIFMVNIGKSKQKITLKIFAENKVSVLFLLFRFAQKSKENL